MPDIIPPAPPRLIADKGELKQHLEELYARLGITPDRTVTAQETRAMMLQDGVRPEDNAFSCAIIAAREGNS